MFFVDLILIQMSALSKWGYNIKRQAFVTSKDNFSDCEAKICEFESRPSEPSIQRHKIQLTNFIQLTENVIVRNDIY